MTNHQRKPPYCSEHHTPMTWGKTEFTHAEDGVEVTVRHIPAWVCEQGDDAALAPGVMDDLIAAIRQLVQLAKQAKADHPSLPQQEYLVRISS